VFTSRGSAGALGLADVYCDIVPWSNDVRGTLVEKEMKPVFWAFSNRVRGPLAGFEAFVAQFEVWLQQPVTASLPLALAIDPADEAEFQLEVGILKDPPPGQD
jgi:hypothetical protein